MRRTVGERETDRDREDRGRECEGKDYIAAISSLGVTRCSSLSSFIFMETLDTNFATRSPKKTLLGLYHFSSTSNRLSYDILGDFPNYISSWNQSVFNWNCFLIWLIKFSHILIFRSSNILRTLSHNLMGNRNIIFLNT